MERKLNQTFVDQYKTVFAEQVVQQVFASKTAVTGKDILNLTAIKQLNFFILKILFRKWQLEMKQLESPFFDFRDPEVRKSMVGFMNILSQHIHVGAIAMKPLIAEAVADTLLLTATPVEFLKKEFEANQKINEKNSSQLLKYIFTHKESISDFLHAGMGEIMEDLMSFEPLIATDEEVEESMRLLVAQLSGVLILKINDLLEPARVENIPIKQEIIKEEEEETEEVVLYDEEESQSADEELKEDLIPEEIDAEEEEEGAENEEESETVEHDSDAVENDPDIEENLSEDEDMEDEVDESEEEDYEEEDSLMTEVEEEEIEENEDQDDITPDNEETTEAETGDNDPVTIQQKYEVPAKTLADMHEEKKVSNIMEAISINHRYMFLQELFDGDNESFQQALKVVETCNSFDEAVEKLIQNYAKEFYWDMNSDEVKELLKVVFRRFRD